MLLQEPGPSQGDLHFSLFGIPVRVHPMFWLVTVMLGLQPEERDPVVVLIWVVAVFISILWHEMGHALTIRSFGYRTWITLYGMGGMAAYNPGENVRSGGAKPWGHALISFAGPAAGFLLAALLVGILMAAKLGHLLHFISPFHLRPYVFGLENARLQELVNDIFFISVFWGLVNLLPIYPLDGGHIARELLLYVSPRDGIRQSLMLSMLAAVLFAIYAAVQWHSILVPVFFGFMAYQNYQILQATSGRGKW